jgi:hypothetical protein
MVNIRKLIESEIHRYLIEQDAEASEKKAKDMELKSLLEKLKAAKLRVKELEDKIRNFKK